MSHNRGYDGTFVEFSEPGKGPRLIDVCSSQAYCEHGEPLLKGWEVLPTESPDIRRSPGLGVTGKKWSNPVATALMIEMDYQPPPPSA